MNNKLLQQVFSKLVAIFLVLPISVFADDGFWDSPYNAQLSQFSSSSDFLADQGLVAQLASTEQVNVHGRTSFQQDFSLAQRFSQNSELMFEYSQANTYASSDIQRNWVLGYRANNLTVSMLRGKGKDYSQLSGDYQGVDPYIFHGGNAQPFSVSGYALDYGFGRMGHLQYGQAVVESEGLLDRKARYFEWSNNKLYARATQFARGTESIGRGLDLGVAFSNKRIALQSMSLDNDRKMQRIRFELSGKNSRQYWVDLSAHQNPLFEQNDDYRVMFNFRTLLGSQQLASFQNESSAPPAKEGEADPNGSKKKSKRNVWWQRGLLIGVGVAAAAGGSSSGSVMADENLRFFSQNDAARDVLNEVNPQSIRINREFGGWVFLNPDGSFGTSIPVQGDASSVRLPDPEFSVPIGSQITASYHTHAAFDPRFDNENFSETDLENDRANNIDGYLATPLGQFKLHDIETDTIIVLGTVATE